MTAQQQAKSGGTPRRRKRRRAIRLSKDPHRWGLIIGTAAAVLVLLIAVARQWQGDMPDAGTVAVWALLAFVVSYGAGGCFVIFLVRVTEYELKNAARAAARARAEAAKAEDEKPANADQAPNGENAPEPAARGVNDADVSS